MGLISGIRRMISGEQPTLADYEAYERAATGNEGRSAVLGKVGPEPGGPGTYKMQQSYDSLLDTVRDLRESLDGQARRQEELITRLSAMPLAAETLPQTSKMQQDMLQMVNDRLAMHVEQQRKVAELLNSLTAKKEQGEALTAIREQLETGNEIDRQLVDSFNRFSMMIDRLHMANNHAVECLQQVRDSYAVTQMQMQEWVEKSRHRNGWLLGAAVVMSVLALGTSVLVLMAIFGPAK